MSTPAAADPNPASAGIGADSIGAPDDQAWAAQARDTLAQVDARLARRFDGGDAADRLIALRAREVDA